MAADHLSEEHVVLTVDDAGAGMRLDAFLAERLTQYSRVQLRRTIDSAGVTVDGRRTKAAYRLRGGETVSITLPAPASEGPQPENTPLDLLYEDDCLIAVNKPPGMVVHPSRGHWSGTLAAGLAYHFEHLSTVGGKTRPGIVHRLDRDTSGVIVVAKNDQTHLALAAQFEQRNVEKEYFAILAGVPDRDRDVIQQPIGVHPHHREKMAIRAGHRTSRDARTFYQVEQRFRGFAVVKVFPKTGRTHQIRVHLAHTGCPVLCDRLYGGRARITLGEIVSGREDGNVILARQALHARRLRLIHPSTNEPIEFEAPLPQDLQSVLTELGRHRAK